MALKPENPVVGGTALRRQSIRSPNYVPGVSGWTINQDGSAEFNNLTLRGTFFGTDYILNAAGLFFYSGTPAAGNLIGSAGVSTAGTDSFTNNYLAGNSSYGAGFATSEQAGGVLFYTGSLAGGWAFAANVEVSGAGQLILTAAAGTLVADALEAGSTLLVDGVATLASNLVVNGTTITGMGVTSVSVPSATIDVHNGNVNLNMARPPNYAAVVAGTATAAQVEACLGGLLTSLTNRQLMA